METTDFICLAAIIASLIGWIAFFAERHANHALRKELRDLSRDYQIEKHRANVFHLRLYERQRHDRFGGQQD